jgi:DNA-binding MarR family transcriptional regulator
MTMTIKEDIKYMLDNSFELSRGEIINKLGVTREQARKPITKLLEAKEIERRIDSNGIEWFISAGVAEKEEEWKKELDEPQRVEPSLGSQVEEGLREIEEFSMERWNRGYKSGYEAAWEDVGIAIAKYLRKTLEIQPIEEQLDD